MPRIKILKYLTLAALGIITVRLFVIQIIEHDMWVAKASEQHTLLETITARRGEIYMMDGDTPAAVVLNQPSYQIIIDPAVTPKDDLKSALDKYAKDYITKDIDEVYSIEGLRYYIVAKNVPYSAAVKIAEQNIDNVWLKKGNSRVYPEGEMGSSILGFVNADGLGQYGVEGSLNHILSGKDGLIRTISDVNNVALSIGDDNIKIPAEDGKDVVLSVDRGLEKGIEEIMQTHIDETAATNAAALVMDPNTGEVIAITNLPGYDPANYGNVKDASAYLNQVTEVPYEPASICKNFAFSAAINEGKMTADTTYFNEGYTYVDGWKIENAEQRSILYGEITMKTALYWSLNTGSIQALRLLGDDPNNINQKGRELLYNYYYNKFRLGQITGIELIEAAGYIEDPNEGWGRDSTYANMTFGQNLGITMIQTATAFSAVVNGGVWRTPTIVKGTLENGNIVPLDTEKVEDQILSETTSEAMRDMLINNRSYRKGTLDRDGYAIGGKSGTAQVIVDGAYDNTMSNLVGSYIAFIGPEGAKPSYVIMVKVWGEGEALGGSAAQSLFESMENFIIDYLKIKPGGV
ncbi:penicillin-binding protein 2 [Candidatus Saccharibacteria bacterium]|nr:penicillin-binding protein 2 [Candidatus Saccharibacteria bacterium]MBQ3445808.1 penicillin-binding protein 2 [Candidatus Saccharibacteria bacterium]